MRLDHLAYRVKDREQFASRLRRTMGYWIDDEILLSFPDGSKARCYILQVEHSPDIFVSEGDKGSIIGQWIFNNGPGLHHMAYEVADVVDTMIDWGQQGITFQSGPIYCPCEIKLVQVFTDPKCYGHIVELIERNGHDGFCEHNVQRLMEGSE